MTENNTRATEARPTNGARGMAHDSAMKGSRRLPDIPGKYKSPAPYNTVRPKPVMVPKTK